jgi:Na+-translocating ferredoxin:NAD+ oxidoreductase RnfA subunit
MEGMIVSQLFRLVGIYRCLLGTICVVLGINYYEVNYSYVSNPHLR